MLCEDYGISLHKVKTYTIVATDEELLIQKLQSHFRHL